MAELVAKQYAEALYEVGSDLDNLDQLKENFSLLTTFLKENPKIKVLLEHPDLDTNEKKQVLATFAILPLLNILVEKGNEESISVVQEKFEAITNERQGMAVGKVITSIPLDESELEKLEHSLSAKLNKTVKLTNEVDESIVGGVKVQIGDSVYDSTIQNQLKQISQDLLTSTVNNKEVKDA